VDQRQKQAARNEALFREVNERVEEVGRDIAYQEDPSLLTQFVCECGQEDCLEKIELTLAQYEAVRDDARRFAVLPGHEDTDVARLIERHPGFLVVEKLGQVADVAIENDPRG
jgi:hypothetical protein